MATWDKRKVPRYWNQAVYTKTETIDRQTWFNVDWETWGGGIEKFDWAVMVTWCVYLVFDNMKFCKSIVARYLEPCLTQWHHWVHTHHGTRQLSSPGWGPSWQHHSRGAPSLTCTRAQRLYARRTDCCPKLRLLLWSGRSIGEAGANGPRHHPREQVRTQGEGHQYWHFGQQFICGAWLLFIAPDRPPLTRADLSQGRRANKQPTCINNQRGDSAASDQASPLAWYFN